MNKQLKCSKDKVGSLKVASCFEQTGNHNICRVHPGGGGDFQTFNIGMCREGTLKDTANEN